jgi:hypothetical protein
MTGIVVNVDLTPFIYAWLGLATVLAAFGTVQAVITIIRQIKRG